ncbi:MAG: tetratricopeptide repeat protein [Gammaproteobacteria bacterium]|nr:tetratricopeptide repeat protein [Gammaproteobacteria bacterium]
MMRTLRSLGQLYAAEEEWQNSINNFTSWRELSPEEDVTVYKGLSYAHYQLEQFEAALPYWLDYMNLSLDSGEVLERDDYTYLNGLYFTLEDFEKALDLTKTMIVKFNNKTDWQNFNAIYASLDQEERRVQALNLAYIVGHIDDEQRYMNLGQSMAGMEIPLSGAKIIEEGLEKEIIEENLENLEVAAQMHLIASTYADGLPNAQRVAEMSDSGDGWDTVGYIHYVLGDYEEAVEAFESAIEKGDLNNRSDTLMFLARARLELDDFDGARRAARQASDAGDESDRSAAQQYLTFIGSTEQRYNIIEQRKAESIDYYRPYPSLIN